MFCCKRIQCSVDPYTARKTPSAGNCYVFITMNNDVHMKRVEYREKKNHEWMYDQWKSGRLNVIRTLNKWILSTTFTKSISLLLSSFTILFNNRIHFMNWKRNFMKQISLYTINHSFPTIFNFDPFLEFNTPSGTIDQKGTFLIYFFFWT